MKRVRLEIPAKKDRLYGVWQHMKERCYAPSTKSYHNYGGRGIKICDEWRGRFGFVNFKKWSLENGYDYTVKRGECTIDRIDVNGDYAPNNCRWINNKAQCNNKRNNVCLYFNGEIHTLSEWADITGISANTLQRRNKLGWSEEEILTRKVTPNGK